MTLDIATLMIVTAFVVNVCGVVFIVETVLRRDRGARTIWALGYLGAMVTTLAYIVWVQAPTAWWAVAAGNAAFVAGTGCMWLGCRAFNGRRSAGQASAVAVGAVGAALAALAAGPEGGDWAGALWMFIALVVFSAAGAFECLRGALGRNRLAWGLSIVLGVEAVFYAIRAVVFVTVGTETPPFTTWLGTATASFVAIALTIVAVVVTSVLTSARTTPQGYERPAGAVRGGIVAGGEFGLALADLCERASPRAELVAVIAVRIEDLEQIAAAFGGEVADDVVDTTRHGLRRYAPSAALVGEDDVAGLLAAIVCGSSAEARRHAAAVYRGVFDELALLDSAVIPVIGVGVALSETIGYRSDELARVARDAAVRAAGSVESSVVVGEDDSDQAAVSR